MEKGEEAQPGKPSTVDATPPLTLRNLTPDVGGSLRAAKTVVSPDGKTIYTSMTKALAKADSREVLAAVDVATGTIKVLLDQPGMSYFPGPVSPDNRTLVVESESDTTPTQAPLVKLHLLDVADGGEPKPLAHRWDRWATALAWLPDGSAVLVKADDDGAAPVFRVDVADGSVTRVTQDAAAYTDVVVAPDGNTAYALRSSYEFPTEASASIWPPAMLCVCRHRPSVPCTKVALSA